VHWILVRTRQHLPTCHATGLPKRADSGRAISDVTRIARKRAGRIETALTRNLPHADWSNASKSCESFGGHEAELLGENENLPFYLFSCRDCVLLDVSGAGE